MITDVYARIKMRMDKLEIKESKAAKDAGLSADAIRNVRRKLEAGNLNVSFNMNTINALAPVLGTTPAWILDGTGPEDAAAPLVAEESKRPSPNASFPPQHQRFSSTQTVPLLGLSSGGPNGRFILNGSEVARLFCPPMLEGVSDAYAVRVYGTSMEPRFKAGETVWINPHEPVRSGDDVIAQVLRDDDDMPESYIKEFRSRSSKVLRLWQHNPEEGEKNELEFDGDQVFSVHKIVFHAAV